MPAARNRDSDRPGHIFPEPPVLFDTPETKLDLRFRAGPFPVRVSPFFWLAAVLLGPNNIGGPYGAAPLLIWMAVWFVSILLHELGHSIMHRAYGCGSEIVLHGFGGYAVPDGNVGGSWRQIKVSLAGPAMNFLIAAVVWATNLQYGWAARHPYLTFAYLFLYNANLSWGLFNMLPIWPLDGGKVCREVCHLRRAREPEQLSLKISIGTALFVAFLGVLGLTGQLEKLLDPLIEASPAWFPWHLVLRVIPHHIWILYFVLFAYMSYELLRQYRRPTYYADDYGDRYPWQR